MLPHEPCNPRVLFSSGRLAAFVMLLLALVCGCETGSVENVKLRGVYTTLLTPEFRSSSRFHAPSTILNQQSHFGTNEVPVAVVTGYYRLPVTLEVWDLDNGSVLMSKVLDLPPGKIRYQRLQIRRSGNYEVRALLGGNEADTFRFSVERQPLRP